MNSFIKSVATNFASVGPFGRLPISGTWGSAVAAVTAPFVFLPAPFGVRLFILFLVFVGGGLACDLVEKDLNRKDPGLCVIDEVLGQWITYLPFAVLTPWQLFWGFVLFRVFDILKPPPVRASECWLPGGFGIMIDDALAGVYAMIALSLIRAIWG